VGKQSNPDAGGVRGVGRRLFLKASALLSLGLSIPSSVWSFFIEYFPVRIVDGGPFTFNPSTGRITWTEGKKKEPYVLSLQGLVDKPVRLSYKELRSLRQVKQTSDFHCVEGWSVKDVQWEGFLFGELLTMVKVKPEARYAVFHSLGNTETVDGNLDHYRECFSIAELKDPKKACLLALLQDGKPLTYDHGSPLRLVAPYDLGYKNIKFVSRIEFAKEQVPGWWTLANPIYPVDAPVPAERLRAGKKE
jgi:DMSO/TMAO reductase YedYZ molybdopterin-dependent catalytic subunit